jgi:DNA-binding CsgD family transcriptional regulator
LLHGILEGGALKTLASRDFARLQSATLALYSHRDLESFRSAVPEIFMELIPADHFSLAEVRVQPESGAIQLLDFWEFPVTFTPESMTVMQDNLFDHPFSVRARKGPVTGALRLSDFVTLAQLRKTRLHREVLGPMNIGRVMSIGAMGGPGLATLTLARSPKSPDFTEVDRTLLEKLRPHFEQARTNLERETLLRANRSSSLKAHPLTPRETEVALWLAQGKTNIEIGAILVTPVRTVEKHVEHILHKLGVENRASAALAIKDIVSG